VPVVRIPTPLRRLTGGEAEVSVDGATLAEVVAALDARHPGLGERILDEEGRLRRFVNVFVRDEDVRFLDGLDTAVADEDVVSIIPAVAGGSAGGGGQPARNGMTAA
jgi:sulfur-carrier protein